MILDSSVRKLQVVLGEAKTTNDCAVVTSWFDSGVTPNGGPQLANTNGTSVVDIVAAPATGYIRQVNELTVFNADTVSHGVTVRYNDNGTTYTIVKVTLAAGTSLTYSKALGWSILSSTSIPTPVANVYLANNQTVTTTAKINFDTVVFDTASYWDATNHRYTPQLAGYYDVETTVDLFATLTQAIGTTVVDSQIRKNGSNAARSFFVNTGALSSNVVESIITNHALLSMNGTTDYIEHWASANNSTSTTIQNGATSTWMAIKFVRPL